MLLTRDVDRINQITLIPNTLRKRIQRECQQIRDTCDEIIVEYTDSGDILVSFKKQTNNYVFKIPRYYPYKAPKLNINDMDQHSFFDLKTNRFRTVLKYVSGLDCLCCNSYLCGNNWAPTVLMGSVIKQIEEYKNYKRWIFIKFILDKLKEKYLNRDIDLDSWLFNVYDPMLCYPGRPIH